MEFDATGCFLVVLSFTCHLMSGCVMKGFGVLLPTLKDQFVTHSWAIGVSASMVGITADIAGTERYF